MEAETLTEKYEPRNLYEHALAALLSNENCVLLDLDGTFALPGEPSANELEARRQFRSWAEEWGTLIFTSARTAELMLSGEAIRRSRGYGFNRPQPQRGRDPYGRQYYVPLEGLREFQHAYDPGGILEFGGRNWLRDKSGGYIPDVEFDRLLGGSAWKPSVQSMLRSYLDPDGEFSPFLAPIEHEGAYRRGEADVAPLEFRIQYDVVGPRGRAVKREFARRLHRLQQLSAEAHPVAEIARRVRIVDESKPDEEKYTFYLVPPRGTKERRLNRFLHSASRVSGIPKKNFRAATFGDTLTDLRAGCYGAGSACSRFVLAGGSRLASFICGERRGESFAGEDLAWLCNRLRPVEGPNGKDIPGVFTIRVPGCGETMIVIADVAYPGRLGAESLVAYLADARLPRF